MPFTNLLGEREALTQNSEDYKKKIIEYMKVRGYVLTGNSKTDGSLSDLIFKRPLADGPKETKIEAKYTDLSLFDSDLLKVLASHFLRNMNLPIDKRYFLIVFIEKCKAQDNWKKVFEKVDNTTIEQLRLKIESKLDDTNLEEFKKHSFDDFLNFITDCHIIQADYSSIIQKITNLNESKEFDMDESFLNENENLIYNEELLTANIMKVKGFPKIIWISKAKKITDIRKFWEENFDELIHPTQKQIISLSPMDKNRKISSYIENNSIKQENFEDWMDFGDTEKINIMKNLIKRYVIQKGRGMGMRYNKKLNALYYPHINKKEKIHKIYDRKVSQIFPSKEGLINFVEHYCITIDIPFFNKEFYLVLDHTRLFTIDGNEAMDGKRAKSLHYKFTRKYAYNNSERSKFFFWKKLFAFQNQTLTYPAYFIISKPLEVKSPVMSQGGEEFSLAYDDDTSLFDYFVEERESDI